MIKIAITGGIGSGKSVVCSYLEKKGFRVIYADKIAREITAAGGRAIPYIEDNFGKQYIADDGSMDRAKMRELVMNNKNALELLEKGTTKLAKEIVDEQIFDAKVEGCKVVFVETALLFEFGAQNEYDMVWLVSSDVETRIKRIMDRDKLDRTAALNIINNQFSEEKKQEMSDEVIYNNSNIEYLERLIDILLCKYKLGR